jgi:hypothetical protein
MKNKLDNIVREEKEERKRKGQREKWIGIKNK